RRGTIVIDRIRGAACARGPRRQNGFRDDEGFVTAPLGERLSINGKSERGRRRPDSLRCRSPPPCPRPHSPSPSLAPNWPPLDGVCSSPFSPSSRRCSTLPAYGRRRGCTAFLRCGWR